jgi:hypothetical protein
VAGVVTGLALWALILRRSAAPGSLTR